MTTWDYSERFHGERVYPDWYREAHHRYHYTREELDYVDHKLSVGERHGEVLVVTPEEIVWCPWLGDPQVYARGTHDALQAMEIELARAAGVNFALGTPEPLPRVTDAIPDQYEQTPAERKAAEKERKLTEKAEKAAREQRAAEAQKRML